MFVFIVLKTLRALLHNHLQSQHGSYVHRVRGTIPTSYCELLLSEVAGGTTAGSVSGPLHRAGADVRVVNADLWSFSAPFHRLRVLMSLSKLDLHPLLCWGCWEASIRLA